MSGGIIQMTNLKMPDFVSLEVVDGKSRLDVNKETQRLQQNLHHTKTRLHIGWFPKRILLLKTMKFVVWNIATAHKQNISESPNFNISKKIPESPISEIFPAPRQGHVMGVREEPDITNE